MCLKEALLQGVGMYVRPRSWLKRRVASFVQISLVVQLFFFPVFGQVPNGDWISDNRTGLTFNDCTSAAFAMDIPWNKVLRAVYLQAVIHTIIPPIPLFRCRDRAIVLRQMEVDCRSV